MKSENYEEEETARLYRTAQFGKQVEIFLLSDVGKYLLQCADLEEENAVKQLKICDPYDPNAIQEVQNKIWRAESVRKWLEDAVLAGLQALEIIEDRE